MRYLKYAFLTLLGLVLFALALANREPVVLRLMTDDMAAFVGMGNQISVPLFLVILGALVTGIVVGLVWEWFREHQYRAEASRKAREAEALKRDLSRLQGPGADRGDEVLALLESGSKA